MMGLPDLRGFPSLQSRVQLPSQALEVHEEVSLADSVWLVD
jgi:hypothetical protein